MISGTNDTRFCAALVEAGYLVNLGADGLYAYGDQLHCVIEGLDGYLRGRLAGAPVTSLRLPPVCVTTDFVRTGYASSFPQLIGAVFGFAGGDREYQALRERKADDDGWSDELRPTGLMLVSAACQPAYPLFRGELPAGGRQATLLGHCFRREPSTDPFRMQAFRQREFLQLGTAADVTTFREKWIERTPRILGRLGLPVTFTEANDPFFGRAGRLLATHQRDSGTKLEAVIQLYDEAPGTALASINSHRDHFGRAFGIDATNGAPAHTCCVGFGLERLALALLAVHGLQIGAWPTSIRELVAV
jgi:seryl-tRNA synthetase